jgi:hypothetical protein
MSLRSIRNAIATLAIISLTAGTVLSPTLVSAKGGGGGGGLRAVPLAALLLFGVGAMKSAFKFVFAITLILGLVSTVAANVSLGSAPQVLTSN